MEWSEEACIISGDNRPVPGNVGSTTIELWCRTKSGHSVLLLVHGINPYIEISDPSSIHNSGNPTIPLESVSEDSRVIGNPVPLGTKLYDGKDIPHWRVFVKGTNIVRDLRRDLSSRGWTVTSSDIMLVHRPVSYTHLRAHETS